MGVIIHSAITANNMMRILLLMTSPSCYFKLILTFWLSALSQNENWSSVDYETKMKHLWPFFKEFIEVMQAENWNGNFFPSCLWNHLGVNSLSHSGYSSPGGGFVLGAWLQSDGWLIRSLAPWVWKFEEVFVWRFHPEGQRWQISFIIGIWSNVEVTIWVEPWPGSSLP